MSTRQPSHDGDLDMLGTDGDAGTGSDEDVAMGSSVGRDEVGAARPGGNGAPLARHGTGGDAGAGGGLGGDSDMSDDADTAGAGVRDVVAGAGAGAGAGASSAGGTGVDRGAPPDEVKTADADPKAPIAKYLKSVSAYDMLSTSTKVCLAGVWCVLEPPAGAELMRVRAGGCVRARGSTEAGVLCACRTRYVLQAKVARTVCHNEARAHASVCSAQT